MKKIRCSRKMEIPFLLTPVSYTHLEEWLINFKNETHNHPTEIEPFGGAATCLGGAIPVSYTHLGYEAAMYFAGDDSDTQAEQIRELLQDEKLKALVISPVDPYGLTDVLEEVSELSIPVIDYDNLIMDTPNVKYFVTFNMRAIGKEIADVYKRQCVKCGATYHVVFAAPKTEGVCDTCGEDLVLRDDDKPETVQKRLNVYHEQTQPLIDYYTGQGVLKTVDGTKNLDEVFGDIVKILGE